MSFVLLLLQKTKLAEYFLGKVFSTSVSTFMQYRARGADKSLARPGRKQATATEDFDVHISYL
jgi:hypothetical protein